MQFGDIWMELRQARADVVHLFQREGELFGDVGLNTLMTVVDESLEFGVLGRVASDTSLS